MMRLIRRALGTATFVGLVAGVGTLDVGRAAPLASTGSVGNSVSARTVAPPLSVQAEMTVLIPGLTCRVVVTWNASPTAGVTDYDVRRVVSATQQVAAGPWTVTGLSFTDEPVPFATLLNSYEWQVRARIGGWTSSWVTAANSSLINCLL